MRTTLTIDDDLLRQLKENAARQSKTLAAVVNDLLRHALAVQSQRQIYWNWRDGNRSRSPGLTFWIGTNSSIS
jgi:hypothetical protein